jgi:hypothetical protein
LQYQFVTGVSPGTLHSRGTISLTGVDSAAAITPSTDTSNPDGRRLFQLGIAFAAAYVLFLAVWFWGTRDRRSRVGGAARS